VYDIAAPPTSPLQMQAWQARTLPPVEQLNDRMWSVPVPIPHSGLRYVLSYLVAGDDGLVVVDPGWPSERSWRALCAGLRASGFSVRDVTGIALTHVHPDHGGLAGRLSDASGAWIGAHQAEETMLERARTMGDRSWASPEWIRACAVPPASGQLGPHAAVTTTGWFPPRVDRYLRNGLALPVSGVELIARHTPGHTRGHLCFVLPGFGLLLSGDHVLPRITPSIATYQAEDEPALAEYLASLELVARLPVTEVLPGHEYRFAALATRAADLLGHHLDRLGEIRRAVQGGARTVWTIAQHLSWSRGWPSLSTGALRAALGETKAHLHYAESLGLLARRSVDGAEVWTPGADRR
jgi:glyoxylase-like metal-dependent hydrolase (beta-lactamase superfamily II)